MQPASTFQKLTLFDVTNLLVGAIVGADIYVVASLGGQYLGPASRIACLAFFRSPHLLGGTRLSGDAFHAFHRSHRMFYWRADLSKAHTEQLCLTTAALTARILR